jgi:hypothetical protein
MKLGFSAIALCPLMLVQTMLNVSKAFMIILINKYESRIFETRSGYM